MTDNFDPNKLTIRDVHNRAEYVRETLESDSIPVEKIELSEEEVVVSFRLSDYRYYVLSIALVENNLVEKKAVSKENYSLLSNDDILEDMDNLEWELWK